MKHALPLLVLLLASACAAPGTEAPPPAAAASQPAADPAAEDARLLAFLDRAFDEATALSPESLTGLGIKQDYGKLDRYTDEAAREEVAL
jgi:hypothetical protein